MNATPISAAAIPFEGATPAPNLNYRVASRWIRVFWPLAATLLAGVLFFAEPIAASIRSTPHPALVYAIFGVAAIASALLAVLMQTIVSEHRWIETLESEDDDRRQQMLLARAGDNNLSFYYRLLGQTREEPLLERQRMLEHELECAESDFFSRLALPNLLSSSLVGLGLVGTFIGLLGTLHELSSVFAALGSGSSGGDTGAMFATMIERLEAPMEGMGTAFVASLFGLLGSLIVGLTATSVRRAVEQLFTSIRSFATQQLHADSGVALGAAARPKTAYEAVFPMTLLAGNDKLRMSIERWREEFGKQVGSFEDVASQLGTQLSSAVQSIASETQRGLERVAEQREIDAQIIGRLNSATADLNARLEALRGELATLQTPAAAGPWQKLVYVGAAAGLLAAIGLAFLSGRISNAAAPQVIERRIEVPVPVTVGAKADAAAPVVASVVVGPGDSLSRIAQREGMSLEALRDANPQLVNPDRLQIGETLKLPPR